MHKDLPAQAGRDGRVEAHGDKHFVPVNGEVGLTEGSALSVHKDMALSFLANVFCEQLVALRYVQHHDHSQVLWKSEADGCSAPCPFILVVRQVHVEGTIAGQLKLVAMTRGVLNAVRLVAGPIIAWQHK